MVTCVTTTVDAVFRALSDSTRRDVIARLTKSPASVSELAAPFDMALPSFVQHLRVLESSGVVRSTKAGRVRTYQLVPKRLQMAEHWMATQRDVWERRMDRFERYANTMENDQ
ncbi:MAG: metalloregulator ArsR/SmtB family transcription factor [Acidimicrobiales bacterium]